MNKLGVALPTSILSTEPGLMLKTIKIYQVIRYSSIFGVDELVFYRDPFTKRNEHDKYCVLIEKIWRYLLTPTYLRRKLIPLDNDLRYVGLLPPLRLEVFNVSREVRVGDRRLGYVFRMKNKLLVDIGLDKPFRVEAGNCREGDIAYIEIVDVNTGRAICLDEEPYRGPILVFENSLESLVRRYRGLYRVLIATSRYGRVPSVKELVETIRAGDLLIVFGGPRRGLYDIARAEKIRVEEIFDHIWNTIPDQRVKTIRSEEALLSTLALINMFRYWENKL
jgi:predicted SPOUT superfamily RNA methylase MTH1